MSCDSCRREGHGDRAYRVLWFPRGVPGHDGSDAQGECHATSAARSRAAQERARRAGGTGGTGGPSANLYHPFVLRDRSLVRGGTWGCVCVCDLQVCSGWASR